jgi:hypothetical protein
MIHALKDKNKNLTELHETNLKVQQDLYNELKELFENLRAWNSRIGAKGGVREAE